jgi:hypothetical protein
LGRACRIGLQKGDAAPAHCDAPPDTHYTWTVDYAIEQRRVILEKTQQSLGNWKKKFQEETCSELPEKCPTTTITTARGNSDWYMDTFHRHVTTKRDLIFVRLSGTRLVWRRRQCECCQPMKKNRPTSLWRKSAQCQLGIRKNVTQDAMSLLYMNV